MTSIRYVGDVAAAKTDFLMHDVPPPVRRGHFHKCGECRYVTDRTSNYTRHYRSLHMPSRSFACCGQEFSTLYKFNQHKLLDHASGEYRCLKQGCNKVFHREGDMECHLVSHDPRKRFVCTTCSNRLSTAFNLRRHQESSKRCKEMATARRAHQSTALPLEERKIGETGVYTGDPGKASTGEAAFIGFLSQGLFMTPQASIVENHEKCPWTAAAHASVDSLDQLNAQAAVSARSSPFSDYEITYNLPSFSHAWPVGVLRKCFVITGEETDGPDLDTPSSFSAVRCADHNRLGDASVTSCGEIDPTVLEGAKILMFLKYGNPDVNVPQ
ncbi:hypothetical protein V5799_029566 [Amblyomma americanum]|uniref:C2H2-type domain-containing protein n=1 Tax=Amblyomma americanum TaxID=6943 RepID=A0AAQ4EQN0_AMBAM